MRSGTPYLVRVCAYLQGGSDLQGGANLKRGLALTCSRGVASFWAFGGRIELRPFFSLWIFISISIEIRFYLQARLSENAEFLILYFFNMEQNVKMSKSQSEVSTISDIKMSYKCIFSLVYTVFLSNPSGQTCVSYLYHQSYWCCLLISLDIFNFIYRQISRISRTKSQTFLVSSCSCLCPVHWGHY